ncbi:MAG TPA: hypothetical protein VEV13_03975 [Candidatus Limnocylindria bacterium]|nr:hypothetical protein [Candidatus Limnocylindria bacterium]
MTAYPEAAAEALASTQQGLVSAQQLARIGFSRGSLAHRLACGSTRAVLPGVYLLDAWLHAERWDSLPLTTRVQAVALLHGCPAVFCLDTAARLLGIGGVGLDDGTVHVQLPPGTERHQVPGVMVHTRLLAGDEVMELGGFRVTTPQRTVLDLVLSSDRLRAVSILDSALNGQLIASTDLTEMRRRGRGRRGAALARGWWDLADDRAQSPLETSVRLIAVDAHMPPDDLQHPVRDAFGVLLGYGDLAWLRPGRRTLIGEADGREPHDRPQALYRDRHRANDFVTSGNVDVVRFTAADTRRKAYIVSQLRRLLRDP